MSDRGGEWLVGMIEVLNPLGLHARPAARFVRAAASFDVEILVTNLSTGAGPARARSLTEVATLGASQGHRLELRLRGGAAAAALSALVALATRGFDESTVQAQPAISTVSMPDVLVGRTFDGTFQGLAAAPGVVAGPARKLRRGPPRPRAHGDPATERAALRAAIDRVRSELALAREVVARQAGEEHAEMLDAQSALLHDDALLDPAFAAIAGGERAEIAWERVTTAAAERFAALDDPYLRARADDVREIGRQILGQLGGQGASITLRGPGILVARELGAAETASLDLSIVQGIAVATGSPASHAAILARALGVPAVVAAGEGLMTVAEEGMILLDGDAGTVTIAPDEAAVASATRRTDERARQGSAAAELAHEPAVTGDGVTVDVLANVATPKDIDAAAAAGADGIGLFRTEFLFMGRDAAPDEEEQAVVYRRAAQVFPARPVIIRTLDAGADKPVPYLALPNEANPFLGVRGIRLGLARPRLLETQLRAILRVAAEGHRVSAMLPMVATVAEVDATLAHVGAAQAELALQGVPPGDVRLGVMVEVPSAALSAAALADRVTFFSIGTNDLTQYTLAAERDNPEVAALTDHAHPAVLRLIAMTCEAAAARGRHVSVCGEAAGDPDLVPILIGLGVRSLSVGAARVALVKQQVRSLDTAQAAVLATRALTASSAQEVRQLLGG